MEQIKILVESKSDIYEQLLPQIYSLVEDESNSVANKANIAAALKQSFPYFSWVGFYIFDEHSNELVLGPFQGKIACTRIAVGKGVCGTSFKERRSIIVPDVNQFPGHIFCDGDSQSEIVIPILKDKTIHGVLDVDSYDLNRFDETDRKYLEIMLKKVMGKIV